MINEGTSQVFKVFNSSTGVEIDLSKKGNISKLAGGINALPGTYTHIYGVVANTYIVAGSTGTCHTKAGSYNKIFDSNFTGWAAHTTNQQDRGDAVLTEQDFFYSTGQSGYFGPSIPNTSISVEGNPVSSMEMYLTHSSNPYAKQGLANPNRSFYYWAITFTNNS